MQSRGTLILYSSVTVVLVVLLSWWVYFFTQQGEMLVGNVVDSGVELSAEQAAAVKEAASRNMRMFLFEGGFLILLLISGVFMILRSMRREVLLHRQQRDLLSAVTHELKSPVASAKLYVQSLLMGRVKDEDKRKRYLENTEEDLDRLGQMVERLLESARISTGRGKLTLQPLDLSAFTRKMVPGLVKHGDVELELRADEEVPVVADASALETILRNLIANAIKYGGEPPRIHVEVGLDGDRAQLSVRDFGPGLQGTRPEEVFEPFVRGENELVKSQPGVGLGLYLVSELVQALGGHVDARNAEQGPGFFVKILLPLATPLATNLSAKGTPA